MPSWLIMWSICTVLFIVCKGLTLRGVSVVGVPLWKRMGYMVGWIGMNPREFFGKVDKGPTLREWVMAFAKIAFGVVMLYVVAPRVPVDNTFLLGWVGMTGIIFILHFGGFHVLSCVWRAIGVHAKPLMDRPHLSRSVSDFWGKRWNTAFRDLTYRFLFRPLIPKFGRNGALFFGFLISGLVHDLVISFPSGGGYGLPTLYFLIQPVAMLIERSRFIADNPVLGRIFTLLVVILPAPLLFHTQFLRAIIIPMMQAVESA